MFDQTVYSTRREALRRLLHATGLGDGVLVFLGNRESPMNYQDNAYRFRQDSSFLYYFGLNEADYAATIDLSTDTETLYADEWSMDMLVWSGPRPSAKDLGALCGIDRVRPREALAGDLQATQIRYLPPYRSDALLELARLTGLKPELVAERACVPLIKAVVAMREIKEEREIAEHEQAVNTSILMHKAVLRLLAPGVSETALMAEAYRIALAAGGMPSFCPITTRRGAILHNHSYNGVFRQGDMLLFDAGAETQRGYAGDLTSTMPVDLRYSARQKAIYEIVLRAGADAAAHIKPGSPYKDAHRAASLAIARGLQDLGLMKGNAEEAVDAGAHALFFVHGVGHQMGLDVHDMESLGEEMVGYDGGAKSKQFGLKSLRMAKPVKENMVLTVEPGIYFIEGLIQKWMAEKAFEAYINYEEVRKWVDVGGFRNEEDWVVTSDGARRLGDEFDKSVRAMESYRSGL